MAEVRECWACDAGIPVDEAYHAEASTSGRVWKAVPVCRDCFDFLRENFFVVDGGEGVLFVVRGSSVREMFQLQEG